MKIAALMLVLGEELMFQDCLDLIVPQVDLVLVCEGGTVCAERAKLCGPNGESLDSTRAILEANKEKFFHLELATKPWHSKFAMYNVLLDKLPSDVDYIVLIDSDEMWSEGSLRKLVALMEEAGARRGEAKLWYWNGTYGEPCSLATEPDYVHRHYQRAYKWKPGWRFGFTEAMRSPLTLLDEKGFLVGPAIQVDDKEATPDHFAHCKPKEYNNTKQKMYKDRGW